MNVDVLNSQPWRFEPGDDVYVRGWAVGDAAKVVGTIQPTRSGWPHYLVVDYVGIEWQIAQIDLSSKPIPQM